MGSVIGSCFGTCVAACGCAALQQVSSAVRDKRAPYLLILFLFTLVAGILRFYGRSLGLEYIVPVEVCEDETRCYGIGAVYRLSFCIFLFFGAHALALLSTSCVRKRIDHGFWGVKLLLLAGLLVICFVLPPSVFEVFRWVAMAGGAAFIIVQVIILIDWAYVWNEEWVERGYKKRVLGCAVFNYTVSLIGMVLLFHFYANNSNCGLEQTFIGVTIGVTLLFSLISMAAFCEHGAILPSSVCTLYCYWILYSALSSNPNAKCNEFIGRSETQKITGFVIAAISVAYNSFYASSNTHALTTDSQALLSAPIKLVDESGKRAYSSDSETEDPVLVSIAESRASRHFQLIMISGACYACMLLTEWGEAKASLDAPGLVSVWVQIVSQWLVMSMYTWSLLAPYILTHRQF